jgi:hypothetical protein
MELVAGLEFAVHFFGELMVSGVVIILVADHDDVINWFNHSRMSGRGIVHRVWQKCITSLKSANANLAVARHRGVGQNDWSWFVRMPGWIRCA